MKTNKFSNKVSKLFAPILIGSLLIVSPVIALAQVTQPVSAPISIPVIIPNPTPTPTPTATPQPSATPVPSASPMPSTTPQPSSTPQPTPIVTPRPTSTPAPTPIPVVKYSVNGQIITAYRGPLIYNEVVARNTRTGQVYKTKTGFNGTFSFKLTNDSYVIKPTRGSNMITFTPSEKTVRVNGAAINNVSFSFILNFWR